eukprot:5291529-Prorocentrum_lima.AAC.1
MTCGGPNGRIHTCCRPLSKGCVVRLVTILACVYRVHASTDMSPGIFAIWLAVGLQPRLLMIPLQA